MAKSKTTVLLSWIGGNDLSKVESGASTLLNGGAIASTLANCEFDEVELLYNYPQENVDPYLTWLSALTKSKVSARYVEMTSPTNFDEIYKAAHALIRSQQGKHHDISFLLSPGTPAMQAVWILLGKTACDATFYESSIEQGVRKVDIPFALAAEYLPAARKIDEIKLTDISMSRVPINAAFESIITRNPTMEMLKNRAQVLADRNVPVLIYGETGTGKELFARAIHNASKRSNKPFIALNCGAIPSELVDSILFGHVKGAFTGAVDDKKGVFDDAHGGTLFLDEFGELTPPTQIRLLRVLQEGTFLPVGGNKERKVDVRIITATHQNLFDLVSKGSFREDLFYRVAVGVLNLPPIREREGDLLLLAEHLIRELKEAEPSLQDKKLSISAKNFIVKQSWRGNVRELHSTLMRAFLWAANNLIEQTDIEEAMFTSKPQVSGLMSHDIAEGVDIKGLMDDLAKEYIMRALAYTGQNKKKAARLLGLKNYQTLNNWMEKYHLQ
ncbi:sigma-54-dependent Fis family transcriptional regulator [Pseudidiomarina sp. 1APP75-32.1]|uniref:Sigma-54-dependent Fis family transcriptional regulator n=1 Tax=Pseudidiomarina terrestris TaxID=2820060 RepID=A0AAW7R4P8_9GAMM|nr:MULTISPECIES: sigma-54 dependent transcriptional regulator [unclassified Pseudidiomarina]MDN7125665.1 sigma-54-dependent Fis family transcriptional regulator [Pseudidiomarina sp. 1APP75-32.1]MDN7130471.1 sigma-54-dependent Fis family transcriptional regulator [Pseudidiomarina sp. 1APR75-15]